MLIPAWPLYEGDPAREYVRPSLVHFTAYSSPGKYCGWPANHGAWQWGNTFLVGYAYGKYDEQPMAPYKSSMHKVSGPILKGLLRSTDGGLTWKSEDELNGLHCDFSGDNPRPNPYEFIPQNEIYRVCGVYDHGGEDCDPRGAIYTSASRGFVWSGPYTFSGLEMLFEEHEVINTSRTCVLDDLIFLSIGHKYQWGSDFVVCAKISLNGFTYLSHIKPEDGSRCVMPAAIRTEDGRIYVAFRRRNFREAKNWIDLYKSDDGGLTWKFVSIVGETGDPNGNPPALLYDAGRLYCAFGNRTKGEMILAISDTFGNDWRHLTIRRYPNSFDFGYPRLFRRDCGGIVCVYYWEHPEHPPSIQATHIYLSTMKGE